MDYDKVAMSSKKVIVDLGCYDTNRSIVDRCHRSMVELMSRSISEDETIDRRRLIHSTID